MMVFQTVKGPEREQDDSPFSRLFLPFFLEMIKKWVSIKAGRNRARLKKTHAKGRVELRRGWICAEPTCSRFQRECFKDFAPLPFPASSHAASLPFPLQQT